MRTIIRAAAGALALTLGAPAIAGEVTLFYDSFGGRAGAPDATKWEGEFHDQGRGQFEGMGRKNGNGKIDLRVRRHNPTASGRFYQEVMRTKQFFQPRNGRKIVIRARVRVPHNKKGIVHSVFLYNQYNAGGALRSDEIDFEWLTNYTANRTAGSNPPEKVLLTTWAYWNRDDPAYGVDRDSHHGTQLSTKKNNRADANGWHTYKIEWEADRVAWYTDGKHLHTWTGARVPTGAMRLFLNSWVPSTDWPDAYNGGLTTSGSGGNATYKMQVDWVEVKEVW